ncbi:RagB/SusD family nutrient uptake outer membrane protein [uncultured Pontibacter sp.]|uniref:RagB/SusD family nutrient uptake outer membrane protein n=1 Tax=uncultured Pontibacter sp. TaxID=453356 RepID=UPI00262FA8C9|nr:RagB/SusD family nutrient uptake outer membrane protein [uncultured Pontibacter sp.]
MSIPLAPMVTSCADDFLEATPRTSVSVESAFDTPERVEAQANGLYATIKSGAFLGGRYQVYNDIRAEEFINRNNNGVTGAWAYAHTIGGDDTYLGNFWITGYLAINRSNLFLEGLDANASKINPAKLQQYKGEAKFVRALTYFSLVQIYAKPYVLDNGASPGLPLRLQGETGPENNGLARSTVAQIYAQILKDLNEAEAELPDNYSSANLNTTRAHKNTAIALKTRVYLAMGNYGKVIEEGNKIVSAAAPFTSPNRVVHALQPSIKTVFTNYTTTESIFSAPMTTNSAPGTQNQLGYYYNGTPNGNREYYLNVNPTGITGIYTNPQFRDTDVRKTDLTATISGQRYVTKFSGLSPFIDWVPIIRYSEVLLNLAEAEAEVGSETRAIALLEAVHKRSDATWSYTGTSKPDLINSILTERRIELLSEGFRTNDIMRRGQSIPSIGAGAQIPANDSRYIFPIPTTEYQTNPLL